MANLLSSLNSSVDSLTGIEGTIGYIIIILCVVLGHTWMNSGEKTAKIDVDDEEEEEPDPPRNFTIKQLRHFDGKKESDTDDSKPVYLSINGTVFDVSMGKDYYGPGGPYEIFAGRECGVALAKMGFDETYLDDLAGCANLNFGEKDALDGWIEQFTYYKGYPVMGRLVPDDKLPSSDRVISKEELAKNDGSGEMTEGYAATSIYIGAGGKVYDMSFGGVTFYGKGCPYNRFAGKDASRALAKMSFEKEDVESSDLSDLTEKEMKILEDWIKTFEERKQYPCVGRIEQ